MAKMNPNWFDTTKVAENIYLTNENRFTEMNRCNIWLIKGPAKDIVIDTGLGVCNLESHLRKEDLLSEDRPCEVIITHAHFDHSGGAHHFDKVYIHEADYVGLRNARKSDVLNYVKSSHFYEQPYHGFSALEYKVPPTECYPIKNGDRIDIGNGEYLEIIHVPGHTTGSICIWYPSKNVLFTGDFVYECGHGSGLLDWLPTSSVNSFITSANDMLDFFDNHQVDTVYPGHYRILEAERTKMLLNEYIDEKKTCGSKACTSCMKCCVTCYFMSGIVQCCPF